MNTFSQSTTGPGFAPRRLAIRLLLTLCLWTAPLCLLAAPAQLPDNEETAKGFSISGIDGSVVKFQPGTDENFRVVCFLGTECPLVKLYANRLSKFSESYQSSNVKFLGINSNRQDSLQDIENFAHEIELKFPIGKDFNNTLADEFRADRTPEVFLIAPDGQILYRGRIDDQFSPGVTRARPQNHFLKDAIDSAIEGKAIEIPRTEAEGCIIGRVADSVVTTQYTFTRDISQILQSHCVECHRPDQIGPMSLTDYEEIIGWGEMIVEVIEEGRMPPWHADPDVGKFSNARNISDGEIQLVRDWVDGGMPYGNADEMPAPREFTQGWRLPKEPDLIVSMRATPFVVPADGTVEYQYFVVDPGFETDRWVRAAEVVPGNHGVVHHSIVFIRPPDGSVFRGVGWLGAYVPGQSTPDARPGFAIKIPAGSKLVFQQHYTPNGKISNDITKVGLVFVDPAEVTHEVFTLIGLDQDFEIAPNEAAHSVELKLPWFPRDGILLASSPHMHFRGKSFELSLKQNGETTPLLQVPRYDFNWQHNYRFLEPIKLSNVDSIDFRITFDNSDNNPFNPDPTQPVSWGDQTWEEMAVAFFQVAEPLKSTAVAQKAPSTAQIEARQQAHQLEYNKRLTAFKKEHAEEIDAFIAKFDANNDGKIAREEMPNAVKHFGFWQFDLDDDGFVSADEWAENLMDRLARKKQKNKNDDRSP